VKHKVSELEGALLDTAVAKAEGLSLPHFVSASVHGDAEREWSPSDTWEDGGPIIERERIACEYVGGPLGWEALMDGTFKDQDHGLFGPTLLIAAMRAYVASKFGDEVDLP
jgi:hypothetical protein